MTRDPSISRFSASVLLALVLFASNLGAQSTEPLEPASSQSEPAATPKKEIDVDSFSKPFARQLLTDQRQIWTGPLRIKASDAKWLLPLAGLTAIAFKQDNEISHHFDDKPSLQRNSLRVSNAGPIAKFSVPATFLLLGKFTGDARVADTGRRTLQAGLYSTLVIQGIKQVTNRKRPYVGGDGGFWNGGNAFPSGHSAEAWALAKVVSDEYSDKPLVKFGMYSFATAVSLSRLTAQRHYASDVLVGSAIGYFVGKFVMRNHHAEAH
jgi:hypothetical protein